ncbi:MFS transporter [Edaphobacter modestus]|uniref:ACS family hexuronate transporter-like MFS transporter n=1 Tax=Edaphobacter modestus TaxID=388466 RepID=A0A4Q7XXH3_9BACT|nr:MFS transporter [Edaphobacter modestus]RZU29067.1 ACS family hexuronate transporter-like MFS transporter [Edaphobacter modestus]
MGDGHRSLEAQERGESTYGLEEEFRPPGRMTQYRWKICALLFFATTLNYMDRQVLALLKPTLQDPVNGIGLTEVQFAAIVSLFSAAYAIGLLLAGRFIDRVGTRIGYACALTLWTVASASHSLLGYTAVTAYLHSAAVFLAEVLRHLPGGTSAGWLTSISQLSGGVIGFALVRFILGLGEAGNFPAAIKAVAEWFPRKERALATGIFNSGTNIGATIAPFAVGFLLYRLGWRYSFLTTSVFAVIWLILWLTVYSSPAQKTGVSPAELAYINQDVGKEIEAKVPWSMLLPHRQTWAFLVGKVFTDPIWWFYLYWLPGFLHARFGLSLTSMGLPLLVIYNFCTVGSIAGGWLPARLIGKGWTVNRARKTSMLLYALLITPITMIGHAHSVASAVALISLATAAHQAWSANLFTLASDMFPRRAVASIVGIGACGGSVSMMFFGLFIGFILTLTRGNYAPVFALAGLAYLVAIAAIHLLVPRLEIVSLDA